MKLREHRWYFELGKLVLWALPVVLMLPLLWPLRYQSAQSDSGIDPGCQPATISGVEMKNGFSSVDKALYAIKKEDGILVMGTSETGSFGPRNFWGILNKDARVKHNLTVLSGAGRTCYVYFPLMLTHPDAFRGLRAIYFINPIYWATNLNHFRSDYFSRYNSESLIDRASGEAKKRALYERFMRPGSHDKRTIRDRIEQRADDWRSYYYVDFLTLMEEFGGAEDDTANCLEVNKSLFSYENPKKLESLKEHMNLDDNISDAFTEKHTSSYVSISPDSTFQYEALAEFIQLTAELEMDVAFFLGPFNSIYAQKYAPKEELIFRKSIEKIRFMLDEKKVTYIDGSHLSYETGTFNDLQHHSRYGAWRIAQLISQHYEKQEAIDR